MSTQTMASQPWIGAAACARVTACKIKANPAVCTDTVTATSTTAMSRDVNMAFPVKNATLLDHVASNCHFQNYLSRFENYLSSLARVRKLDKAHKFLYLDFILGFLPKIWCPKATIQPSLRIGKNTRVSFTV